LEWLTAEPSDAAQLVQSLAPWMLLRGHVEDLRSLALPVARALHESGHATATVTVGSLSVPAIAIGEVEFVLGPVEDALAHAEECGDFATATACLQGLAFLDQSAQRWRQAADYAARSGQVHYQLLGEMAFHSYVPGDLRVSRDALAALADAVPVDSAAVPYLMSSWANTLLIQGRFGQVRQCYEQALRTRGGATRGEPTVLLWVLATGAADALYRNDRRAIDEIVGLTGHRALRGVAAFWAEVWQQTVAIASHRLCGVALDSDRLVDVAVAPIPPTAWRIGYSLIARQLLDHGSVDAVMTMWRNLDASALSQSPYNRLFCTSLRASIAHVTGDVDAAQQYWRELLQLSLEQDAAPFAIDALEALASINAASAPTQAARQLGAAQAARAETGYSLRFAVEAQRVETTRTRLNGSLSESDFAKALGEGAALSLADAGAYTQRSRGERRRPTIGWESLTPTEHDVARLVARGATNPDIARQLLMSVNTVKTHLAHIYTKLDIDSRAELTSFVVRHRG
jgi:DNA-binding CsgD family transcriptional regulator